MAPTSSKFAKAWRSTQDPTRSIPYPWKLGTVRVPFEGALIFHPHQFLRTIREDVRYRAAILEEGVFVIHIPAHLHRFRNEAQFAGFFTQRVGLTRRYKHIKGYPRFDISCRREVRPEYDDPQTIGDLLEKSSRSPFRGWEPEETGRASMDEFFCKLNSTRLRCYQQFSPLSVHSMDSVVDLNAMKDPGYYWKLANPSKANFFGAKGVTSTSLYISIPFTGTGGHVEDCCLCGINYMDYGGSKLWIVLNPAETLKLIEILKEITGIDCAHIIDSKEFFIHPALLNAWGLKYTLVVQKEGDFLVTIAGSLHFVLNMDFSINTSVNYFDLKHDLERISECALNPCTCYFDKVLTDDALVSYESELEGYRFARPHGQNIFPELDILQAQKLFNEAHMFPTDHPDHPLKGYPTGVIPLSSTAASAICPPLLSVSPSNPPLSLPSCSISLIRLNSLDVLPSSLPSLAPLPSLPLVSSLQSEPSLDFACSILLDGFQCGLHFRTARALAAHKRITHFGLAPTCAICGFSCSTPFNLRRHIQRNHS